MFGIDRSKRMAGAALATLTVAMLATTAHAQGGGPVWMALDTTPPGTPADVVLDPTASSPTETTFEVLVHGFWLTDKTDPTGVPYREVEVPGLGRPNIPGAPLLPVAWVDVAVPSDASEARLLSAEELDVRSFSGINVWPQPIPELDDEEGTPEVFQMDPTIYGLREMWPSDPATSPNPVSPRLGHIRGARCGANVGRWNPTTLELQIVAHGRYSYLHPGVVTTSPAMTKERGELAAAQFVNWPTIDGLFPINGFTYDGLYLIIYPEAYDATLSAFVSHKFTRGFWVTKKKLEDIGNSCEEIRTAIANWYNATDPQKDHYCLLVGDTSEIPLCDAPDGVYATGTQTDDLYGSVNGDDLMEEVFVGRISMDDQADLANQLDKIIHYETTSGIGWNRRRAVLVAHKEDAPGKYQGAHETVRNFPFNNQPQFITRYGAQGATDADVSNDINGGVGVVAYRGHGSSSAWTSWNLGSQSYDATDVNGLTNGQQNPVVWSFACTNAYLPASDCIAENWMERVGGGSVSYYGATRASYTDPNHALDLAMFKAVFHGGLTSQGQAICHAEWKMEQYWYDDNSWMYLLLGDPSMEIQSNDGSLTWLAPTEIAICPACTVDFQVLDELGNPVPGALVAVWKPGQDLTEAEVFANRYADANGMASIEVAPETIGTMYFSVRDEEGHVRTGTIEVTDGTVSVPDTTPTSVRLAAAPTVFRSRTSFSFGTALGDDARLLVMDASGRLVKGIDVPRAATEIGWDGSDQAGRPVASGVYLARLDGGPAPQTVRLVVLR